MTESTLSVGDAAKAAGVTTRTLRYYEQLGLLHPTHRTDGGTRRYSLDDVARVARIRRLQEILGHDLARIAVVLGAEDRLGEIRTAWHAGDDAEQRRVLLDEAVAINDGLRAELASRRAALDTFAAELETKARRYRAEARRLNASHR
ncbi:MAG: MerR family transcriptional regulator [Actinomycetota bacterium]